MATVCPWAGVSASLCFCLPVCASQDLMHCKLVWRGEQGADNGLTRVCLSVPGGLSETLPRRIMLLSERWYLALTDNSLQFAGLCSVIDWALSLTSAWALLAAPAKLEKAIFPFTVHLQFSTKLLSPHHHLLCRNLHHWQKSAKLVECNFTSEASLNLHSLEPHKEDDGLALSAWLPIHFGWCIRKSTMPLTQPPAWRQTRVMGLFHCTALYLLLIWQIYLKTGVRAFLPRHHQHSNKQEYWANHA